MENIEEKGIKTIKIVTITVGVIHQVVLPDLAGRDPVVDGEVAQAVHVRALPRVKSDLLGGLLEVVDPLYDVLVLGVVDADDLGRETYGTG